MNTIFFKTLPKKLHCFIALFLAAILGSGLFLSLMSLPSAVETSFYNYLEDSNIMDMKIISSIGFSGADAAAVANMDSVEALMPVSTVNALLSTNGKEIKAENGQTATAKISSIDVELTESSDKGNINRLTLLSGRYPKNDEECVVDADACMLPGIKVGNKITFTGDGEDILTSLSVNEYTIVGTVDVPTYLTKNLGSEKVGSGELNALFYIPSSSFITDNFTELYICLSGLEKYNYSGKGYFEKIQSFSEEVLALGAERSEARAQLVAAIAKKQLESDKAELDAFTESFQKELQASKDKLAEIDELANSGDTKIKDKETEVENSLSEKQKALLAKKEDFVKISDAYIQDLAQYNIDREKFSEDRENFVNNFSLASSKFTEQSNIVDKLQTELETLELKIDLNQQVVDGYTDPSKMPDLDAILNNIEETGYDRDFIKYMKRCANDTSKTLGKISLSEQQLTYASKKIEYSDAASIYNQYRKIIENYDSDIATLQNREDELKERKIELEKQKDKIERENQDILTGDDAITNETFKLQLELAELKIRVTDAVENKKTYEEEYKKIETEGNTKIENLTRSLESNEILINNTDAASWSVSDVRSLQGYNSFNTTVSAISSTSKLLAILTLVITAIICVSVMTKYAYADSADFEKLKLAGITKQSMILSYLTVYIPIYIFAVLCGVAATTYLLPIAVKQILSIQFTIPTIKISVPILYTVIALAVLVIAVPVIFSVVFRTIKFKTQKTRKKAGLLSTVIATVLCLSLTITSGGFCLSNYLDSRTGLAETQGILYDAIADFSFPMQHPDKTIFIDTAVDSYLFAQKHTVTGVINYDLFVVEDARGFSKFISTENRLTDDGIIISSRIAKDSEKKVGQNFEIKLSDGSSQKFKIIGISENTTQSIIYMSENKYEESFKQKISYNCAFLNFEKSKLSVAEIDEALMKNAAISKVSSTESIDNELSLNNSISNIILISIGSAGILLTVLSLLSLLAAGKKRKNHHW